MDSKIYNVGIIGYGLSAKVFHIPLIETVPQFKLHAVVQRSPKCNDNAEKDHAGVRSYRSTEDMLEDAAIDVVVVTTTPETHHELTKLCLESGKHVVVEKPFTTASWEADELITLARERQRLLTVYQNRRWDSDFLTLSELIDKAVLGRIVEFETHFDRHRPQAPVKGWKSKHLPGGGVVYDLGSHLIDQIVLKFGLPAKITGFVGTQREPNSQDNEDSCTILLHYTDMLATVKAAVVSPEVEQLRYWVRGEEGSYKKFHLDCQEDQLKGGKKPGDAGFGVEPPERQGTLTVIRNGEPFKEECPNIIPLTYRTFYSEFAKALSGEGLVPVKPEDARDVIRLIELARESSHEGRTLFV